MTSPHTLAVLGGSGLYEMDGLTAVEELVVETPFGPPSDVIVKGRLGETTLLFLPRHGRGHRIAPHEINYRANVAALKMSGATHLVSVSAVGSMREDIAPGDLVVPDQFIDLTKKRTSTFFEDGIVAHVAFADPVCPLMAKALGAAAREAHGQAQAQQGQGAKGRVHEGGTYVVIDGPQFSTRAESRLYRSWGVSVIGMTAMPEAKLAREAQLPYATLALSTDYDCWHTSAEAVTVDAVLAVLANNVTLARRTLAGLSKNLPAPESSPADSALKGAIMTDTGRVTEEAWKRLAWLLG